MPSGYSDTESLVLTPFRRYAKHDGPCFKRIVSLAGSYKCEGRCCAGKELHGNTIGGWLRPVSKSPTAEISLADCRYADGTFPKVLDVIDIPMRKAVPHYHQTENHLIHAAPLEKVGEFTPQTLARLVDHPASLWLNTAHTKAACNDCMSQAEAASFKSSLTLIKPESISIEVRDRPGKNKKKCRALFIHHGARYNLSLTEPYER